MIPYKFCYSNKNVDEVVLNNNYASFSFASKLFILYNFGKDYKGDFINMDDTIIILMLTTSNSAHSISEVLDFLDYYLKNNYQYKIGVNSYIVDKLPFIYQLFTLFIPKENIIIFNENNVYKINKMILKENGHFNYTNSWNTYVFKKINNIMIFDDLTRIRNDYCFNIDFLNNKIVDIYNKYKDNYKLYDNIMLIKTSKDKLSVTINRAIEYPNDNVLELINNNNIKFLSITDFNDIYEYICVFYHAKNIIVSYGGVACTNRYFSNPDATVILIGNIHYKYEYEYKNENGMYWHVRHSHLFSAKRQYVLLNFENELNYDNINEIFKLIK